MFKVTQSPTYWKTITAEVTTESGRRIEVKFDGKFKRMTVPEINAFRERLEANTGGDDPVAILEALLVDWRGVSGDDEQALPFSREGLQLLVDQGFAPAVITAFFASQPRAKEKN